MKKLRPYLVAAGALLLAACANQPLARPGYKLQLQTIYRPDGPNVYLYREVPDPDAH
jgi:hypothetical protein